jgi:YbbR domain-containing protein
MFSLRQFFTKNPGLKIISLFLAVVTWMFVVGEQTAEISLTIPLEIVNVPTDLVVVNDVIDNLTVRVSGPRSLIRRLANERLSKTIDLKGVRAGKIGFEILPEELPLPGGVKVTRLSPSSITLELEKIERKRLNILPVLQGSPEEGYEVVSVKFTPSSILVSGPSNALSGMDAVWTKPINVEKKTESFRQPVTLDVGGGQIILELKEPVVAEVTIEEKVITRVFRDVPVKAVNSLYRAEMRPSTVNVQLMGPLTIISAMEAGKDLIAEVDLTGLSPGGYHLEVSLNAPKELTVIGVVPPKVEVTLFSVEKGE